MASLKPVLLFRLMVPPNSIDCGAPSNSSIAYLRMPTNNLHKKFMVMVSCGQEHLSFTCSDKEESSNCLTSVITSQEWKKLKQLQPKMYVFHPPATFFFFGFTNLFILGRNENIVEEHHSSQGVQQHDFQHSRSLHS